MRPCFVLLFLLVSLIPFVNAETISHSGWYYAGDTFDLEGTVYSVEGSSYESVLIGAGSQLQLVSLHDCKTLGRTKYCYIDTAYPADSAHIKYEAGEQYFGYQISIETTDADISASREIEEDNPELGEKTGIDVTIVNDGEFPVTNIIFTESIPQGLSIVSGPRSGNAVLTKFISLQFGKQVKVHYDLKPTAYGTYTMTPQITYDFEGGTRNVSLEPYTINVQSPLDVDYYVSPILELDDEGTFDINITNEHESEDLRIDVAIGVPSGVKILKKETLKQELGGSLSASFSLEAGTTKNVHATYRIQGGGDATFPWNITFSSGGSSATNAYTSTTKTNGALLAPSITVTPKRDAYVAGSKVSVAGILENTNTVRFTGIQGVLSSELFKNLPFSHEGFPSGKKLTEASTEITLPKVAKETTYPITFVGTYRSPLGTEFEFSSATEIDVIPSQESVAVTRTLDPAEPKPGDTVKVVVDVENKRGEYLTFDAHEQYPSEIIKGGGLTYAEASLDKGAKKQLYLYEITIPENITQDEITIMTVIRAKDANVSEEYPMSIRLRETQETDREAADDDTAEPITADVEIVTDDGEESELGFFASIVDFFKRLFA